MDQRSTSDAASQAGDQPVRSARWRSCSYCGPARSRSCAGFYLACAVDAPCCVPYVVTLLRPAPRLGTVAVTTPSHCPRFIPTSVPFLNRPSQQAHRQPKHHHLQRRGEAAELAILGRSPSWRNCDHGNRYIHWLLHEVQGPARDQERQADHDEEWTPGHRGPLPRMQYEDLQNRRDQVNTPRNANTESGCHRSVGFISRPHVDGDGKRSRSALSTDLDWGAGARSIARHHHGAGAWAG